MEDTIKIELLTPLTGTFLPNEMEQDWEEEDYNDFEEEQVFFEGDDLTEYASVIQEKIAEYNRVGHDDDRTDNLMDYFDGSAAIKEKVVSAVPSVKESDGVLYGCTTLELKGESAEPRYPGEKRTRWFVCLCQPCINRASYTAGTGSDPELSQQAVRRGNF